MTNRAKAKTEGRSGPLTMPDVAQRIKDGRWPERWRCTSFKSMTCAYCKNFIVEPESYFGRATNGIHKACFEGYAAAQKSRAGGGG